MPGLSGADRPGLHGVFDLWNTLGGLWNTLGDKVYQWMVDLASLSWLEMERASTRVWAGSGIFELAVAADHVHKGLVEYT